MIVLFQARSVKHFRADFLARQADFVKSDAGFGEERSYKTKERKKTRCQRLK
nr:MAG TPA: hypothetical protein [Caudoviricetes sp.]